MSWGKQGTAGQPAPTKICADAVQLLRQAGHTLQVELSAHQGIALHANDPDPSQTPPPEAAGKAAEEIVWGAEGEGSEAEGVSLLKGFVSYEQLAEYMESGGNLSAGRKRDEEHTISMRGPGPPPPAPTLVCSVLH